jgi:polar amino acid transport system substrate-binding protein
MRIDLLTQQKISDQRRLVLSLMVALACDGAAAGEVIELARSSGALTAALVNISPWTYPNARQDFNGIETEIIRELSRVSGLAIDIKIVPYARELMMLEKGAAVLTVGVRTENIDQLTTPLAKLGDEDVIIVSLAGAGIASVDDLPGKLIAQVRDAEYLSASLPDPRIRKYDTNGYDQSVSMLLEKRVDAIIGLRTSLSYAMRKNPKAESRVAPAFTLTSREFCILVSRTFNDQDALRRLQDGAKKLVQKKYFEHVRNEYKKSL